MNEIDLPNKTLERQLRRAITESLHELLPEFNTHVRECPVCEQFHEWVTWKHVRGTSEWVTECPETGTNITLPFEFGPTPDDL